MGGHEHSLFDDSKHHRMSNILAVKAVDHGMRSGINVSLAAFTPPVTLKALTATESRVFVEYEDLPDGFNRKTVIFILGVGNLVEAHGQPQNYPSNTFNIEHECPTPTPPPTARTFSGT